MKRPKQLKGLKTWNKLGDYLEDLVRRTDRILGYTPDGSVNPELYRYLKRAISGLIDAEGLAGEKDAEETEARRIADLKSACARLTARGVPELPGHVKAEIQRIKRG